MEDMIREDGGSQFTLQALFKELKKKLLLVVAIVLLCTAAGGVFGAFVVDTKYTSNATMIVNVGNEGTLAEAQSLATALKSITEPENDAIYNSTITTFNAKHPDSKITLEELKSSVSVTSNSMLLNLTIVSTNAEANLILDEFMRQIRRFANEEVTNDGVTTYRYPLFAEKVDVISYASKPVSDAKTKVFKHMALFFIVGAFGSMLLVLLSVLLNNTYADKSSFERDYDIDVLATLEDIRFLDLEDAAQKAEEVV
ncbi:MAG: hypothetical protein IKA61_05270 [Clostridia bacterium]|nr:hypothetical protein [Clostridia bacterium]